MTDHEIAEAALRLARRATNAWACYATRAIELNEIGRLHKEIDHLHVELGHPTVRRPETESVCANTCNQ